MASYVYDGLCNIKGIQPIKTSAGMFMMIKILNDQLVVSQNYLFLFTKTRKHLLIINMFV